jgi:serine/threonine protein kinase
MPAREWSRISKNTHIATVYDVGEQPSPWLAFDNADFSLEEILQSLRLNERIQILGDLGEAFRTANMYNYTHGGLTPDVIRLREQEGDLPPETTVADWGVQSSVQRTVGDWTVTPYTAPEQVDGSEASPQSDIYQYGAVAYFVLTGEEPFADAENLETAIKTFEPPTPTAAGTDLPPDIDGIIQTAMAKNPEERYDSPYELSQALLRVLE